MSGISQDVVCAVLSVGEVHINDPLLKEGNVLFNDALNIFTAI